MEEWKLFCQIIINRKFKWQKNSVIAVRKFFPNNPTNFESTNFQKVIIGQLGQN